MNIKDKVVVVTGGGGGIGAAMCRCFATEGAAGVVVADVDEQAAQTVADEIGGLAVACNVAEESEIRRLIETARARYGVVDIFCGNAGIMIKGDITVDNDDWQRIWAINVMAHIHAARLLVPDMLERGGGCLVFTASAAGLLSQIGSMPYSVTKHALVGLAENLAITYGDRGIRVSVVCPQAVATAMTRKGGGVAAVDGMLEPEAVAETTITGLKADRFMILPHPEVETYMQRKTADYDRWISGMQRLQKRFAG